MNHYIHYMAGNIAGLLSIGRQVYLGECLGPPQYLHREGLES